MFPERVFFYINEKRNSLIRIEMMCFIIRTREEVHDSKMLSIPCRPRPIQLANLRRLVLVREIAGILYLRQTKNRFMVRVLQQPAETIWHVHPKQRGCKTSGCDKNHLRNRIFVTGGRGHRPTSACRLQKKKQLYP